MIRAKKVVIAGSECDFDSMQWILIGSALLALISPIFLLAGMVSISQRDVKQHQFRMLSGYGSLSVSLIFLWSHFFESGSLYHGSWIEAFSLLFWLQTGLGMTSLFLAGITLWAVYENAWELHRRTGMFAYLGGTITALTTVGMLLMIFLG